jgi:predicted choloylglycine hydrolase
MNKNRIHCSFMAAWGSKTQGGKLYTMRNLDWNSNMGINQNKIIFIWKVKDSIPLTTIGFPGIIGALAGMSQAGLTVHEAGLDSMKQTELGFQWTLRLRYILMNAHNLA